MAGAGASSAAGTVPPDPIGRAAMPIVTTRSFSVPASIRGPRNVTTQSAAVPAGMVSVGGSRVTPMAFSGSLARSAISSGMLPRFVTVTTNRPVRRALMSSGRLATPTAGAVGTTRSRLTYWGPVFGWRDNTSTVIGCRPAGKLLGRPRVTVSWPEESGNSGRTWGRVVTFRSASPTTRAVMPSITEPVLTTLSVTSAWFPGARSSSATSELTRIMLGRRQRNCAVPPCPGSVRQTAAGRCRAVRR